MYVRKRTQQSYLLNAETQLLEHSQTFKAFSKEN